MVTDAVFGVGVFGQTWFTRMFEEYTIDGLFEKLDIRNSHTISTYLTSDILQTGYLIDTLLQSNQEQIDSIFDTLLQMSIISKSFDLDTILQADISRQYLIDMLTKKLNTLPYNLDVILLGQGLTKQHIINAVLSKSLNLPYNIDIITQKKMENSVIMDIVLELIKELNTHLDVLLFREGIINSASFDIRIGRALLNWIIDTCTNWNGGTYIANTQCVDGDLVMINY